MIKCGLVIVGIVFLAVWGYIVYLNWTSGTPDRFLAVVLVIIIPIAVVALIGLLGALMYALDNFGSF